MKNREKVVFALFLAALTVTACGLGAGRDTDSGEMAVPEVSSEDLLVDSLQYLLQDEEEDTTQPAGENGSAADTAQPAEDTEESGLAADADAAEDAAQSTEDAADSESVADAVIYYADAGSQDLSRETAAVEELTAETLLESLAQHNIVSLDTKVLSFEQTTEEDGEVLHLDLSNAFSEYLETMSDEAEAIIVSALADTFLDNYDADAIRITVEGETLATDRAEYGDALLWCTPQDLLSEQAEQTEQ